MRKFLPVVFLVAIATLFFYKTVFTGFVPFPGDLLTSEYNPWKAYSFLGYNPGSFPNKAQYFDTLRQLYPWKTLAIQSIKKGEFPLWNPHNFSGMPLFANFQSAILYPFNLLYLFLSQITAWTILVILQPVLALIFTYFYARKLKISQLGSILSSVSYGFCSFFTVWLEYNTIGHVILWLPLILLSVEHLISKINIRWSFVFILSMVCSILAGHPQIFFYLVTFVAIYILVRARKVEILKHFLLLIILSLGICAIQLVPGLELMSNAARSLHPYDFYIHKILIQWWQGILLFVPDFFGNPATRNYWLSDTYVGDVLSIGLVPLFFVAFSLTKRKDKTISFFWITSIIVIFFIFSNPLSDLLYNVPFIGQSGANLSAFILLFSFSILAGFGLDFWIESKKSFKQFFLTLLPFAILFLSLWVVVEVGPNFYPQISQSLSISKHNLLYSSLILFLGSIFLLGSVLSKKFTKVFVICLIGLSIFDLWKAFDKFNPFVSPSLVYPKVPVVENLKKDLGINRYFGIQDGYIEANFDTQLGLYSLAGYDPLYPKRYGEFIQSGQNGKISTSFTDQTRSDAVLPVEYNPYREKILSVTGVKFFLGENGNQWFRRENKNAVPRVFLTSDYKVFKSNSEFEKFFFDSKSNNRTIFLEEAPQIKLAPDPKSSVSVVSYASSNIGLQTYSKTNQLLILSDTYYPGWKAFIDGKQAEILRSDYTFRSVVVPLGSHTIKFSYEPQSFKIGSIISGFSFILLFPLLYLLRKRRTD